ncbi:hypothetical protein NDU88_012089 [Pleurodeles waltl]|uniref:Uncharacterized protein n=1 Tax=Pleurodeles waltl TaxID=8319 RepID=A0AAV7S8Q7_PLEWA|nr:hypothetical protein NDU88_012089 [Pleurodeles waltl]
MSHAVMKIAVWFALLGFNNKTWHTQSLRSAESEAAGDQERPGGLYPGGEVRGGPRQHRKHTDPRQHLPESHRTGTGVSQKRPMQHYEKGSHTAGEPLRELCVTGRRAGSWSFNMHEDLGGMMPTSLGSCKGRSAWEYCTAWAGNGLLHPSWTVGREEHKKHFSSPPVMQDPRSSAGEGIHAAGCRCRWCLQKQGSDSFTPREIPSSFWCRLKTSCPQRMHDWANVAVAGRSCGYNVADGVFLLCCRLPGPGASRCSFFGQKSKWRVQRIPTGVLQSESEEPPKGETLNSPERGLGHLAG